MSIYDNTFTKDGVKLPYMTGVEYDKRKKDAVDGVTDVTAPTLAAAGQADLVKANAINRNVAEEETSAFQLDKILGSDSALMKRAESQGLQRGASRGLLNSSIAVEAAQGAMIDRAQPFALNDASTYFNTAESNMRANNQAELTNAQMGTELNIFNTGQDNTFTTTQAGLDSQASIANAASANSALFSFLDRENAGFLQQNQQTFTAGENLADRTLRETLQKDSITAAAEENALNRKANTTLQDDAQAFGTSENELNRLANSAENKISLASNAANVDKNIKGQMLISKNNAVTAILSDPDTTVKQKENLILQVQNVTLESIDLISTTIGVTADTDNADTTASAAETALSGVSAAGGFSSAEVDQVYDAINSETATVNEVSEILNLPPGDVSAAFDQITNDRAAAAAANNASPNTGLLNSFEDYDLYDRRYGGGEGQRV